MREAELYLIFTGPLDRATFGYMVTGSVASIVYGEARLTHDVDIVLDLGRSRIPEFVRLFPLNEFYCPPEEVLGVESGRSYRGHFNLVHHHSGYRADVYLQGRDTFHAWAMARRKRIDFGEGHGLWVAPPEYVVTRKLQFYKEGGSEKHLGDIRGMLDALGDSIDMPALEEWTRTLGVEAQWQEVRSGKP
jgi:hypothetical protein